MKKFYALTLLVLLHPFMSLFAQVEPLIEDDWVAGGQPYNAYNPIDPETGQKFLVTCTETTTGRILDYWNWPITGKGSGYFRIYDAVFDDIFYETEYQWDKMPNELAYDASEEEYQHIALLLRHCMTATKGEFNGGDIHGVTTALVENFRMKNTLQIVERNNYTREAWINLTKNELDNGRPIIVTGITPDSPFPDGNFDGHMYICDGYNAQGLFHVSFGWGPTTDGYYDIDNFGPYPKDHKFIIGIEPDYSSVDNELEAHFITDTPNGTVPFSVTFQNKSINAGEGATWLWDFGDGTTSIEQNPTHAYTSVGKYSVSLTVSDNGNENTLTKNEYIYANEKIAINEQDSLALVDLYNTNGGVNWLYNDYWLTGPLNTWQGVTITEGRVTVLSLYSYITKFGLTGELISEITKLTALKTLRLSNNELTGSLPANIGDLTNLEELILDDNQFSGSIPESIGNLTKLNKLNLSFNNLSGEIPGTIGDLTNLEDLQLGINNLSGIIPNRIGNCVNLEQFVIQNTQISGSIPASIGNLNKLKILYIPNNELSGSVPSSLTNLSNLERFSISGNKLEDLPDLTTLPKLSFFELFDNYFTFEDLEVNMNIPFEEFDQNGLPYTFTYLPQSKKENDTVYLNEGDNYTLQYEIGGTQNSYKWYKDGLELTETTSQLPLTNIGPADEGIYHCEATNPLVPDLTVSSQNFVLTIAFEINVEDSLALVAFYNENGGESWTYKDNWLTGPLNSWYGIEVEQGRITAINMFENYNEKIGVTGQLTNEITNLTALRTLNLRNNDLTGPIPKDIGKLIELKILDLCDNNLTDSIPESIGNLSNLIGFNLAYNNLSGELSESIGELTNLESLNLTFNSITGELPVSIGNLTNLKTLRLNYNNFSGSVPTSFANLSNLSFIDISNNKLENLPDLRAMKNINYFILSNNYFTFEDLEVNMGIDFYIPEIYTGNPYTFVYTPQKTGKTIYIYTSAGRSCTIDPEIGGTQNNYTWYKNNVEISETGSQITMNNISASDEGSIYYCTVTNNSVPDLTITSRNHIITLQNTTSIEQDEISNINFYPNPVLDILTIETDKSIEQVKVFDLSGKIILDIDALKNSKKVSVDLQNLRPGAYLVKITGKDINSIQKVIKK